MKNNLIDLYREYVRCADMCAKSAIEAIHRLSVENDRLRAEVEMLRKRLEAQRKTYGIAGRYISRPDGTVTRIDQSGVNCHK